MVVGGVGGRWCWWQLVVVLGGGGGGWWRLGSYFSVHLWSIASVLVKTDILTRLTNR